MPAPWDSRHPRNNGVTGGKGGSTRAMQLSVVIVNYNNDRVLRGCLESLPPALDGIEAEVIVSDNGSTDGSLPWIREKFPAIRILENGTNLGFAEANNRAFPMTTGKYILLLNPDTIQCRQPRIQP